MNSNVNSAAAGFDLNSANLLQYPRELTLMSSYMNDVQAKQFREQHDLHSFRASGFNLTVLSSAMEAPSFEPKIIDSGIRRTAGFGPEAA